MISIASTFTVFFEGPFWVGVYERRCGGALEACRLVFGAEPRESDVLSLLLERWSAMRFSPPAPDGAAPKRPSPKRAQREIGRLLLERGASTKAQAALSALREQNKLERAALGRRRRELEKERGYELRREKRREKHRGR